MGKPADNYATLDQSIQVFYCCLSFHPLNISYSCFAQFVIKLILKSQTEKKHLNLHSAVTHLCARGMQDPHAPPVLQDVTICRSI